MKTLKIKEVKTGGPVNHMQMLAICSFAYPILICLIVFFGESIDKFCNSLAEAFLKFITF